MSTANVSGDFGSLTAFGTTTLSNASLNGGAPASSTPAANTTLFNAGGLLVVANEQTVSCILPSSCSLQVNGLHFTFTNFFTGSDLVNGSVVIAHSEALLTAAVPEPATWSMFGVGVVGLLVAVRRRRPAAAA